MAITLTDNEFFTGISNLALFLRLYATNTSRRVNEFVDSFTTEALGFGDTKIFRFSNLPDVEDYKPESSLLTVTKVDTDEEYLVISETKVIKSSYNSYIMNMAFASETGVNDFIGYILGQMESAKNKYLYEVLTSTFLNSYLGDTPRYDNGTPLKSTQIIEVDWDETPTTSITEKNAQDLLNQKNLAKAIQYEIKNLSVFSKDYNCGGADKGGYEQALDLEDLRLVVLEPYKTDSVIDLFATLLNSKVIDQNYESPDMLSIPKITIDKLGATDGIAVLMHKKTLQLFYKFTFMGSFFDQSNLSVNNFLHAWFGYGDLRNLPVVAFKKKTV